MEQKNLEKLIWEVSSKTKIPNIPDKKEAWEELNNKEVNDLRGLVGLPSVRIKAKTLQGRREDERRKRKAMHGSGRKPASTKKGRRH